MNTHLFAGLCAAALALAAAACALPAAAQSPVVWKASDAHPLGYPTVEAIMGMGMKLVAATSDRISVQIHPSMQLDGEKEMIEQAQVGALRIARISVGAMGLVVDLNVCNLPFIFRDEAPMRKVIDGPIGAELLDKINADGAENNSPTLLAQKLPDQQGRQPDQPPHRSRHLDLLEAELGASLRSRQGLAEEAL